MPCPATNRRLYEGYRRDRRNEIGTIKLGSDAGKTRKNEYDDPKQTRPRAPDSNHHMFITQAKAQYRPVGDDGITASPKVRTMLNERVRSITSTPVIETTASYAPRVNVDVAASPKVRQMLSETKARTTAPTVAALAVNQPGTAADGIAASPKVRAQLNERSSREIQIAPLK